jgi:hypothetical protein
MPAGSGVPELPKNASRSRGFAARTRQPFGNGEKILTEVHIASEELEVIVVDDHLAMRRGIELLLRGRRSG